MDKSFYGILHESNIAEQIRDDTRENWSALTHSLANAGGDHKAAAAVAFAVESVGTQVHRRPSL